MGLPAVWARPARMFSVSPPSGQTQFEGLSVAGFMSEQTAVACLAPLPPHRRFSHALYPQASAELRIQGCFADTLSFLLNLIQAVSMSVCPSTKFSDFNEICYVDRGR